MRSKELLTKFLATALSAAMVISACPNFVLAAAEDNAVTYTDGTYTKTATVEPDEWEDFEAYDISVDVTVEEGKIARVAFSEGNTFGHDEDNETYSTRALNGRGSKVGVAAQIIENNGVEGVDAVSTATCTSNAIISAVSAALEEAKTPDSEEPTDPETPTEEPTDPETPTDSEEPTVPEEPTTPEEKGPAYVLMNIPYDEFYSAEGVEGVDAVTTATVKTYNMGKAAGSYHAGYDAPEDIKEAEILGVTYPVLVEDPDVLSGLTKITADSTATITVASGKSALTTKEVTGEDVLFASGDYAYYVMAGEPAHYKELTVNEDGTFTFSAVSGEATTGTATTTVKYACNYTDIELIVEDEAGVIAGASAANAIILTTSDGKEYALQHVVNEWDRTDLGWNWTDLDGNGLGGKTIEKVTYYLETEGVYSIHSYDVNVTLKQNPGTVTAAFEDANTITLTELPEDIENATATVKTKVGRGETATVIAEDVKVENGTILTTNAAENGTYVITIVSDNYGDISVNADFSKTEEPKDDSNKDETNVDDSNKDDTNVDDSNKDETNVDDSNKDNTDVGDVNQDNNIQDNEQTDTDNTVDTNEEDSSAGVEEESEDADESDDSTTGKAPKTGDPASLMELLGMMAASGVIGIGTFRKREEDEE